ncbi:cytochrome P450 [Xylariaceae sp. FL0016]|nr:cytochrome P450 [Xylariaceae sp. FL0016]
MDNLTLTSSLLANPLRVFYLDRMPVSFKELLDNKGGLWALLAPLGFLCCIALVLRPRRNRVHGASVSGRRWWWEPDFILQWRFIFNARDIINTGYRQFKDQPFVVRRHDVDITVMPNRYLTELRLFPTSKLSAVRAQVDNLGHKWTYTTVMTESNLHFRVIQNKLIAELPKYLELARTELDYGWDIDVPHPEEWQRIDIQGVMRMLVARMSAKVFMGSPACRNEEWLKLSIDFSIDLFTAAFTLRMLPPWSHPVLAHLIPARYRVKRGMKAAERIVGPLMDLHRVNGERRLSGEDIEEEDTLLNWMIDHGDENENRVASMSHRQIILSLASIHTTSMMVSNMIFDLCAYPEWFPVLREEISELRDELGPIGTSCETGVKGWLPRLEKLDSFFVESQRINPPILLAPQRVSLVPLTLKDGTHIPAGTRLSWANHNHLNDPSVTSNPHHFDPMRNYRQRHSSQEEMQKHMAGQVSLDNLSFGYGKLACPGRAFSVGEIKLILCRLLHEFEFEFPNGESRRPNMYADENVFPDPNAHIMMRKRKGL